MQHSLSHDEYQSLLSAKAEAEQTAATLRAEILALRSAPEEVKDLCETLRAAVTVVQFAVAHLPPESVRNWPSQALERLSRGVERSPIAGQVEIEMAIDWRAFVREVEVVEDIRRRRSALAADGRDARVEFERQLERARQQPREEIDGDASWPPRPPVGSVDSSLSRSHHDSNCPIDDGGCTALVEPPEAAGER